MAAFYKARHLVALWISVFQWKMALPQQFLKHAFAQKREGCSSFTNLGCLRGALKQEWQRLSTPWQCVVRYTSVQLISLNIPGLNGSLTTLSLLHLFKKRISPMNLKRLFTILESCMENPRSIYIWNFHYHIHTIKERFNPIIISALDICCHDPVHDKELSPDKLLRWKRGYVW